MWSISCGVIGVLNHDTMQDVLDIHRWSEMLVYSRDRSPWGRSIQHRMSTKVFPNDIWFFNRYNVLPLGGCPWCIDTVLHGWSWKHASRRTSNASRFLAICHVVNVTYAVMGLEYLQWRLTSRVVIYEQSETPHGKEVDWGEDSSSCKWCYSIDASDHDGLGELCLWRRLQVGVERNGGNKMIRRSRNKCLFTR